MIISAIVAVSKNQVIGHQGTLPWKISSDLKWFRKNTTDHCIIMGRKNFEDIGFALPKRFSIVMSRKPQGQIQEILGQNGTTVFTPGEALAQARLRGEKEVFIIGGAEIYKIFWPQITRLYLTEVHAEVSGDVFLKEFKSQDWKSIYLETPPQTEKDQYPFTFKIFERL